MAFKSCRDTGCDVIEELTEDEGRTSFDETCRRLLGIPAADFVFKWDSGELDWDSEPHGPISLVAMLLPLWR